jgi:hypothetical protein
VFLFSRLLPQLFNTLGGLTLAEVRKAVDTLSRAFLQNGNVCLLLLCRCLAAGGPLGRVSDCRVLRALLLWYDKRSSDQESPIARTLSVVEAPLPPPPEVLSSSIFWLASALFMWSVSTDTPCSSASLDKKAACLVVTGSIEDALSVV